MAAWSLDRIPDKTERQRQIVKPSAPCKSIIYLVQRKSKKQWLYASKDKSKDNEKRLSTFCLRLLSLYLAKVRAEDMLSCLVFCYQIRMGRQRLGFCLFSALLDTEDKDKRRHCTKDCLGLLSLSSSLLAMIKPFLKVASFELQKPL